MCEFNVPSLFGILAYVVQYFRYCKDFQYNGHKIQTNVVRTMLESFCVQSHSECLAIAVCVHHMLSLIIVL